MASSASRRTGTVTRHRSGDRWTIELALEEREPGGPRRYSVFLTSEFASEVAAGRAGDDALAEWRDGRVEARELMLRELAGVYRRLRQAYKTMQPSTVPTTRSAWERAIAAWEQLTWISAVEAARYREHVGCAFAPDPARVRKRQLPVDAETDPGA